MLAHERPSSSPATLTALRVGDLLDGKFRIEREIGKGGMGVVYQAQHMLLGKTVAIKIMQIHGIADALARQRFVREAQVATALSHPNIVGVREFGTDAEGYPYLVMDYLTGQTLDKLIKSAPETRSVLEVSHTDSRRDGTCAQRTNCASRPEVVQCDCAGRNTRGLLRQNFGFWHCQTLD